jgi:glutamate-1-semialdehyde aminotransferase
MKHSVDSIMGLAYNYADEYADSYDGEKDKSHLVASREALRAALTEALAGTNMKKWEARYKQVLDQNNELKAELETTLKAKGHDMTYELKSNITSADFGVPPMFVSQAENYAQWRISNNLERQVQKPLTTEQIQSAYIRAYNGGDHGRDFENAFARAIEKAHGII